MTKRLVIAISGASGIVYGVRLLDLCAQAGVETHLVASKSALVTLAYETSLKWADVKKRASKVYANEDVTAAIASGSFRTDGMIIAPCSMKTLGEIASGAAQALISRAADVTLKERRRLVIFPRETPLHLGHLRNMVAVTEMGAIVAPPMPAFYTNPQSVDEIVDHGVGRLLDLFDIDVGVVKRWGEA
ncbi:MAG: UbiX family flavin prenyltransferase [Alphaproteobacteria bacterium]|nr:UbiX family flavin prenyltransferase [Alphaproteobacteria bacterium]